MRVRLTAGAIVAAVLGVAVSFASSASAESTPSAFGSRLVTLINDTRAAHGLRALTVTSGTSTVAAGWTAHMAQQQALSHNPNLGAQLESHGSPNWTTYAENVGDGDTSSADAMFQDYMNSPEHRANILDPSMRYVGVGVVFTGSLAWNTLDFVDQYSSTSTTTTTKSTTTTKTTTTTTTTKPAGTTTTQRTTTAAPRTATVKTTATAPRTTSKPATRVATVRRATAPSHAKAPAVTHRAPAARPVVPAAVPAVAHVLAAPSPAALTTPAHGSGSRDAAPLVAVLMIVLVAGTRFGLRALLRRR